MRPDPAHEPAIDNSLAHYLEGRALQIAQDKVQDPGQRSRLDRLVGLRAALMQERAAFHAEATARRHARGEIYTEARVAAIHAMGPSKEKLDDMADRLYLRQTSGDAVLRAHARAHFGRPLMSKRSYFSAATPDVASSLRARQEREEAFASAWLEAIGDAAFTAEIRRAQREALLSLRASTRPMHFVSRPVIAAWDDSDALALGKIWKHVDDLAAAQGIEALSDFIAVTDDDEDGALDPVRLLSTLSALIDALHVPETKVPGKRAALATLGKLREAVAGVIERGGRAHFEVDL